MTSITSTLHSLQIDEPQRYRGLTVFPLLQKGGCTPMPSYVTLDEALNRGVARVTEVNQAGTVPELCFRNDGAEPVLLLGGEELIGAKQNRILNLTVLAPGRTTMKIPVSCVEAGRWRMDRPEFQASPQVMPRAMRAKVAEQVSYSMRETGARRSDQHEVWNMVSDWSEQFRCASPTSAMADVFEKESLRLDEFQRAFQPVEKQVGMAFCLAGRDWGLDLFDHPATLRHYFPKLMRSYSLEALETAAPEEKALDASQFLERLCAANAHIEPAIGLGKDVRLSGSGVSGAGLDWDERYVHLCGFSGGSDEPKGFHSRMQSVRERFRR